MSFLDAIGDAIGAAGSFFGGLTNASAARNLAYLNIAAQQQFAQKGLQWKAADATAAQDATGINRLALLGASTNSFSNVAGDSSLGEGVAQGGKQLGEAIKGLADDEGAKLDRELTRAKIDAVKADVTHQQLVNSQLATSVVAPGPVRSMPWDWNKGGPRDPRPMRGAQPLFSRYYDPSDRSTMDLLSPEASQATQSAASLAEAPILALRMYLRNLAGASPNPGAWRESDKMAPWFPWN